MYIIVISIFYFSKERQACLVFISVSALSDNYETSGWIPVQEHHAIIVNATSVLPTFPFRTVTDVSITIRSHTTALICALCFVQILDKCTN